MILILTAHGDQLTDLVINWLSYNKAKFYRINDEDFLVKEKFDFTLNASQTVLLLDDRYKATDFTTAWYRKFGVFRDNEISLHTQKHMKGGLLNFYGYEFKAFINVLYYAFNTNLKWLCDPRAIENLPKIKQLIYAAKAGLDIPQSMITNDRSMAKRGMALAGKEVLIKPIGESEIVTYQRKNYYITPKLIDLSFFKDFLAKRFFPSLIQEYLDKEIELRIFYLDGICYPMAIFSQLDEQTKVDFRNYNFKKPNRFVPYKLPQAIETKLKQFMDAVALNTGSIDMIKTKDGRYVFLEVNPTGQFGMVSGPCNYFLEEKIAQSLIHKST